MANFATKETENAYGLGENTLRAIAKPHFTRSFRSKGARAGPSLASATCLGK